MLAGHFAAGLAIRTAAPRAPTLGLMIGVSLLDLIYGVAVMFGIEGGRIGALITPWSHSLVMALIWALLYGVMFVGRGLGVATAMTAAVFSHWLLDLVSHGPDMQLWPHSPMALGYARWFGGIGGWLEILLTASGLLVYVRWAQRQDDGRRRGVAVATLLVLLGVETIAVR